MGVLMEKKDQSGGHKRGPKGKYLPLLDHVILSLAEEGRVDNEMARILGIHRSTFYRWLQRNRELCDSLKEAKNSADQMVEAALFQRAVGYSTTEEKVFCYQGQVITHTMARNYPPDVLACLQWLRFRRPSEWGPQANAHYYHEEEEIADPDPCGPKGEEIPSGSSWERPVN
jgi:hypothetical protein